MRDEFMTSIEVCRFLGFSLTKLRCLGERGELLPCRILPTSRKRLYRKSDVLKYLNETKK